MNYRQYQHSRCCQMQRNSTDLQCPSVSNFYPVITLPLAGFCSKNQYLNKVGFEINILHVDLCSMKLLHPMMRISIIDLFNLMLII